MPKPEQPDDLVSAARGGGRDILNTMSGQADVVVQVGVVSGDVHLHAAPRTAPQIPRQLPAAPRVFTGRTAELAALDRALIAESPDGRAGSAPRPDTDDPAAGATVMISAIGGAGGVGKIWLALTLYYSIEGVVQAWADGAPNYGLQVAAVNEGSGPSNFREYLSSEWSGIDGRGPVLFVEYEAPERKKAVPFYIPAAETDPAPTDQEMADHSNGHDDAPYVPVLTEQEGMPLRANANQAVKHDSGYGFYPPDDVTREEWVNDLDLPSAGWEPEPDTTPPAIAWTDPSAGQTDVALDAAVTAVFDEPVTGATLIVKAHGGAALSGTVSTG